VQFFLAGKDETPPVLHYGLSPLELLEKKSLITVSYLKEPVE
jgi:hypothetical protein